jgi:peptide/nickel transport system permease protein
VTVYLVRRTLRGLVVLLVVSTIVFTIFFVMPSTDPAVLHAGRNPTPADIAQVRREFGLDRPVWVQYGTFLWRLVRGDEWGWPGLGFSYENFEPVRSTLLSRLPVTAGLVGGAVLIWLGVGIPLGIAAAARPRSLIDRGSMLFAIAAVSVPAFWLGLVLLYIFWFKLGIAHPSGYVPLSRSVGGWFSSMLLPWITLAVVYIAWYARMTRASVGGTLQEDFIRTARAKGASPRRVLLRHALQPGLSPVVTMLGLDVALLFGGTVVVETIFNLPGMGQYAYTAIQNGDLPAIMGTTLLTAVFIVVANLLVDIAYVIIDPRVRLTRR